MKSKEIIPYIVIIIVVFLIRTYIATPVIVSGDSMLPTLKENQLLLLNKASYYINDIKRYDIVVIKRENDEIIKRVIGLPGEVIEYRDNVLYVNGHEVDSEYDFDTDEFNLKKVCNCTEIPSGKYLVLGDNRKYSADSRILGLFDESSIEGKVNLSLWPIKKVK